MPVIPGEKTPGERFPGAQQTFSIEAMMRDGRALQAGTSHYFGQRFAKAFDITYTNEEGVLEYCYTTSWGVSTRLIGGVIMAHGDDKGLILPPRVAPHQVVIVPIGRDEEAGPVREAAGLLAGRLRDAGVRVHLDERYHLSPGNKFNEWELRGVPLRVELGPRDLAAGVVTLASRLAGPKEKDAVDIDELVATMPARLEAFQRAMFDRATEFRDAHTVRADTWEALVEGVATGFAIALWCGSDACDQRLKEQTTATPRCIPLEGELEEGACVSCGAASAFGKRVVFARAY